MVMGRISPSTRPCAILRSYGRDPRGGAKELGADIEIERGGCGCDGLRQRFASFVNSADLAQRSGKPADGRGTNQSPASRL